MSGTQAHTAVCMLLLVCVLMQPAHGLGRSDRGANRRLRGFSDSAQVRPNGVITSGVFAAQDV